VLSYATLNHCRKLATAKEQRYVWEKGIIKNVEDELGNHKSLVVLP